jgi:hypothetical protein
VVTVEAGCSLFGNMLLVHQLFIARCLHNRLVIVMAAETFFIAYYPLALYKLKVTALAPNFGLFHGFVGDGFFIWLYLFLLDLERFGGNLVAESTLGAVCIEFSILEMTEKAFFPRDLKMFLFALALMTGGAVKFMAFDPFLPIKMLFMGKLDNAFCFVGPFVLGIVNFLCPVFTLFALAGCGMAPRGRAA